MTHGVALTLFAAMAALAACDHPTDEALVTRFTKHRGELEQLIRMFEADKGLGRVGKDFTRPDDPSLVGVSPARIREYRRLCEAVGAERCIEGYDATFDRLYVTNSPRPETKDPIWIIVSASGFSIGGSSKGFLYSHAPHFEVVPNLEHPPPGPCRTWIKHIDGPWYEYFECR
jgi:hypothetical protein